MSTAGVRAGSAFKSGRNQDWTCDRVERLTTEEVRQLRQNAETLQAAEVIALCDEVLKRRPKGNANQRPSAPRVKHGRQLISRNHAFQARGVYLPQVDSSWSGIRKSDGTVVMTVWASAVVSRDGACSQLLWAPNDDGSRPWSDTPAGQERLQHCKLALERGEAEGLLVYGEPFAGRESEDNARTVYGVDPDFVLNFKVERRGEEYWAVWGARARKRAL